jgi:guanylate kinase
MKTKGLLVIISAPSGGGKDSVIKALIKLIPHAARCLTTTSRPPRPGNVEGVDYHFISEIQFKEMVGRQEFVEYNKYAGNYYGTEKTVLDTSLRAHEVVFTQVETNGKRAFDRLKIPHLSIFLMPESIEVLRDRIVARGGLTREEVQERMEIAKKEMSEADLYDLTIINYQGKFEETVAQVHEAILAALVRHNSLLTS